MTAPLDIHDFNALARRRVPKLFFDYADSGSRTVSTYRANDADFGKIKFRQGVTQVLDIIQRELDLTLALCGKHLISEAGPDPLYRDVASAALRAGSVT